MKRLILASLLSLAASAAFAFPVTIDSCGAPLTFDAAPKRAVIHDINMAKMAFALGLQPSIVGVTGITGWYKTDDTFKHEQGSIPNSPRNIRRWKTSSPPIPTSSSPAGTTA